MPSDPSRHAPRPPRATLAAALLLLILGSGCVSWDPVFRAATHLVQWIDTPAAPAANQ